MRNSEFSATGKKITFPADGYVLKGMLHLPTQKNPPVVIGSHGLFSSGASPKQIELAERCNSVGIAFFRFDHRGCGQSDGIFAAVTSLDARCRDLMSAINTIIKRNDIGSKIGLFGSSMGGLVVISVASQMHVDSLVTVATPVSDHSAIDALEKATTGEESTTPFGKNIPPTDVTDKLSSLHHVLIFHGDADELIPASNALAIYEKANHPKKLVIQSGGDHRMSDVSHQETFIKEAVNWFLGCFNGTIT